MITAEYRENEDNDLEGFKFGKIISKQIQSHIIEALIRLENKDIGTAMSQLGRALNLLDNEFRHAGLF